MAAKQLTLLAMAVAVLRLEVKKGHLAWKVTDLGKSAGFSRSLVYQYLGATKEAILRTALGIFLDWFYDLAGQSYGQGLGSQAAHARQFLEENPEPVLFYQRWRAAEGSWVCEELIRAEKAFRQRLRRAYPALEPAQALLVHALLHGLVTAPFLTAKEAVRGGQELEKILKGLAEAPESK